MFKKLVLSLVALSLSTSIALASSPFLGSSSTINSVVPGVGASNLGKAEDAAAASADVGTAALFVRDNSVSADASDGDYVVGKVDTNGRIYTTGSDAITDIIPGVAATNLGKAEDAQHTTADTGVVPLYRVDTTELTGSTATDEDYGTGTLDASGRLQIRQTPKATDGVSAFSVLSATATGTTTVATAATLYNLTLSAQHASTDFWVKIYNKATAASEADTPVQRYFVNAQTLVPISFPQGLALSAGLSIRCVTEAADNGTTAAGSNECSVNGTYK